MYLFFKGHCLVHFLFDYLRAWSLNHFQNARLRTDHKWAMVKGQGYKGWDKETHCGEKSRLTNTQTRLTGTKMLTDVIQTKRNVCSANYSTVHVGLNRCTCWAARLTVPGIGRDSWQLSWLFFVTYRKKRIYKHMISWHYHESSASHKSPLLG